MYDVGFGKLFRRSREYPKTLPTNFRDIREMPRRPPKVPDGSPRGPQNVLHTIIGSQKSAQEAKESPKGRSFSDWQRFGIGWEAQKGSQESPSSTQKEAKPAPRRSQDGIMLSSSRALVLSCSHALMIP